MGFHRHVVALNTKAAPPCKLAHRLRINAQEASNLNCGQAIGNPLPYLSVTIRPNAAPVEVWHLISPILKVMICLGL